MQQANCVWFQPSFPSALTAKNVRENAVVDRTDSVVKLTRTATTHCGVLDAVDEMMETFKSTHHINKVNAGDIEHSDDE